MTIKDIKSACEPHGFYFERGQHDFSGTNDRWTENHNVVTDGDIRLVAMNERRNKWKVTCFITNSKVGVVVYAENLSLAEAIAFCERHGLHGKSVTRGNDCAL